MTWFITPQPAPYFDAVVLEHGYTRGEANATHLHIQVRLPVPCHCCNELLATSLLLYADTHCLLLWSREVCHADLCSVGYTSI